MQYCECFNIPFSFSEDHVSWNLRVKLNHKSNEPKQYLQIITSSRSRIQFEKHLQTDDILGPKDSFSKQKKITKFILLDIIGIKLEINSKRNYKNYTNTWRLENALSNDQWVTEKIIKKAIRS